MGSKCAFKLVYLVNGTLYWVSLNTVKNVRFGNVPYEVVSQGETNDWNACSNKYYYVALNEQQAEMLSGGNKTIVSFEDWDMFKTLGFTAWINSWKGEGFDIPYLDGKAMLELMLGSLQWFPQLMVSVLALRNQHWYSLIINDKPNDKYYKKGQSGWWFKCMPVGGLLNASYELLEKLNITDRDTKLLHELLPLLKNGLNTFEFDGVSFKLKLLDDIGKRYDGKIH